MNKYLIFVVLPILFIAVTSFNVKTKTWDGDDASNQNLMKPFQKIGKEYYLVETDVKKTWYGAAHYCRTLNANLVSLETEDEWYSLNTYLMAQNFTIKQWFWLAFNDIEFPKIFYSISTGHPMNYTKWSKGQPDNTGNKERCVHLWIKENEFQMNDNLCNKKANYICEADKPKIVTVSVW